MRILIFGSKGWIGNQITELLSKLNIKFIQSNTKIDSNKKDIIIKEIYNNKITHVLSLIGRTHGKIGDKYYSTIDYLEQDEKLNENIRDNLVSPMILAEICDSLNIHFTYFGTGCIFSYKENNIENYENCYKFTEEDEPNFFGSSYSIVKGYTDKYMHYMKNVLNIRIRMPITQYNEPRNFITKIVNYEKICSIPNSMSVLPDLLPYLIKLMERKYVGTLNFTNPGIISHNEILEMYKEYVDNDFKWQNFTIEEQNKILSSKRSNNYLDTSKLEKIFPEIKNIKESVKDLMKNYGNKDLKKSLDIFENKDDTILLVTGGAGFIGSHFINDIFEKYDKIKIINFDSLYYCSNVNNINEKIRNDDRYIFINSNLRKIDEIKNIFEKYNITYIIHFAAQSHVDNSFLESLEYSNDNIIGTHNLLECTRLYGKNIKKFIHVSTDEVYGDSMVDVNEKHKTENSVLCPTNPYAATKASAELIASSYFHSFKLPIIITRGNNVYGPNQYEEKLIPKFIKLLNENKKVTIHGDGSCIRSFLYISDTVDAFIKILEKGEIGEIYNIGCDDGMEYSVLEVSKILIKKIKNSEDYDNYIEYIKDRPYNDKRYYISNNKLKNLGWEIKINFEKGINKILK
jgi:dTDP-glucose 4,6-dehydratase